MCAFATQDRKPRQKLEQRTIFPLNEILPFVRNHFPRKRSRDYTNDQGSTDVKTIVRESNESSASPETKGRN